MWYVQLANQTVLSLYFCFLVTESFLFYQWHTLWSIYVYNYENAPCLYLKTKGHCFCTRKSKCTWRRSMYFSDSRAHAIPLFVRSGVLPLNMLYFKYSAILMYDICLWPCFEDGVRTEKMHDSFSTGNFCKKENKNNHFWALPGVVWSPFPIFILKSSKDSVIPACLGTHHLTLNKVGVIGLWNCNSLVTTAIRSWVQRCVSYNKGPLFHWWWTPMSSFCLNYLHFE